MDGSCAEVWSVLGEGRTPESGLRLQRAAYPPVIALLPGLSIVHERMRPLDLITMSAVLASVYPYSVGGETRTAALQVQSMVPCTGSRLIGSMSVVARSLGTRASRRRRQTPSPRRALPFRSPCACFPMRLPPHETDCRMAFPAPATGATRPTCGVGRLDSEGRLSRSNGHPCVGDRQNDDRRSGRSFPVPIPLPGRSSGYIFPAPLSRQNLRMNGPARSTARARSPRVSA